MKKLKKWLGYFLKYIPFKILDIFFKRKDLILFGTGTGLFHDNSKYLFLYCLQNESLPCYWIARTEETYRMLKTLQYPVIKQNSLISIWFAARARTYVITAEVLDIFPFISNRTKLIQLWHGVPIKKIGYDYYADRAQESKKKKILGKNFSYSRFDYLSVDKEEYIRIFSSAFKMDQGKIKVHGQPRNHVLMQNATVEVNGIEAFAGIDHRKRKILYAPTYRANEHENIALLNEIVNARNDVFLEKNNCLIILKLHPFLTSKKFYKELELSNFKSFIDYSSYSDIQELILLSDALISDYSSLVLDYTITGKPINIFAPDWDSYVALRNGFYSTVDVLKKFKFINSLEEMDFNQTYEPDKVEMNLKEMVNHF